VFGLSGEKLLILGLLAVFILGPERLPGYAKSLANMVKSLRKLSENAKNQLKEELGDEYEEVDWRKLDPRQYDPRRIIREALTEDLTPIPPARRPAQTRLKNGEEAPFDSEST
jgi:sec-independent protein translocase protein TatB